jgi:formylglycine-generating enzyme required for sulfatase activity
MNPPTKPTDTRYRVFRGGCWYNFVPSRVRAESRDTDGPAFRNNNVGFRCALRGREPRV